MAVISSGFFDAVIDQTTGQPDRKYSAEDFGAIFDGIISDGIFEKYPDSVYDSTTSTWSPFKVIPSDNDVVDHLEVSINPGRAWFNGTWTLLDDIYTVQLDLRNAVNPRIDGIYLEINKGDRKNSIVVVKGSEATTTPVPTEPTNIEGSVYYYLLARVYVKASPDATNDQIVAEDITDFINKTGGAPYAKSKVTNPSVTTDAIIKNLEVQFNSYQGEFSAEFNEWFEDIKDSIGYVTADQTIEIAEMVAETYSTDYLSGGFPYFDNDCLFLSSKKDVLPPVIINFGFVSGSMFPNKNVNELTVYTETIQSGG